MKTRSARACRVEFRPTRLTREFRVLVLAYRWLATHIVYLTNIFEAPEHIIQTPYHTRDPRSIDKDGTTRRVCMITH